MSDTLLSESKSTSDLEQAPEDFLRVKPLRATLSKTCFDLASELPPMMRHWPKLTRMGLGRKLEDHVFTLLDSSVFVSNPTEATQTKMQILQNMSTRADSVLVYLRLGLDMKDIDSKRYRRLADTTMDIGRQVGGLKKHLAKASGHV